MEKSLVDGWIQELDKKACGYIYKTSKREVMPWFIFPFIFYVYLSTSHCWQNEPRKIPKKK